MRSCICFRKVWTGQNGPLSRRPCEPTGGSGSFFTITSCRTGTVEGVQGVGSRSFGSGQDHQVEKPCAARAVAEGRTGHIVGCLDYETLGRRQFFQYCRDLVTGVAVGAFQNPCEFNGNLAADVAWTFDRERLQ